MAYCMCTSSNIIVHVDFVGSQDSDEEQKQTKRIALTQERAPTKATPKVKSLPAKIKEQDSKVSYLIVNNNFVRFQCVFLDIML